MLFSNWKFKKFVSFVVNRYLKKKRVHDATDSNKVVKPLNCRTQSTVLLLINGGSEYTNTHTQIRSKKSCETHIGDVIFGSWF